MNECREDGHKNLHFTTIYPYMVDTGLCKKPVIRYIFTILYFAKKYLILYN